MVNTWKTIAYLAVLTSAFGWEPTKEQIDYMTRELQKELDQCPENDPTVTVDVLVSFFMSTDKKRPIPKEFGCFFNCVIKNTGTNVVEMDSDGKVTLKEDFSSRDEDAIRACLERITEEDSCKKAYIIFDECLRMEYL